MENKLWRFIKDLWILLTNKISWIKGYREIRRDRNVDEKLASIDKKLNNQKVKNESILLKQILDKKIFDKKKLLETIKGEYFLLIVFAFPRLPRIGFNEKDKEIIEKFLRKKLEDKKNTNKRNYTIFLTEKLKFKKLGYSTSTNFFVKIEDLPNDLRKINNLKDYLEKNLILQQREEWALIINLLSKSRNHKIMRYVNKIKEKSFDQLYNISFYLDSINFKKENVFVQDENSFLITNFLKLEDLISDKKNLESLKENFKFFDISLFFTNTIPKEIKETLSLDENQGKIKSDLSIENFFEDLNKEDLKKVFIEILGKKYEEKYINSFYNKQRVFRNLLIDKGVIN